MVLDVIVVMTIVIILKAISIKQSVLYILLPVFLVGGGSLLVSVILLLS